MAEKMPIQTQPAPVGGASLPTVVIAHHDVHGVAAGYLAARAFGAIEVYSNFPQTAPENLIQTLQNLYAAASQRLRVVIVDIPVDLKNPVGFIQGLEQFAVLHDVVFIDHHESSVRWLGQFRNVKPIFLGPSALTLNNYLLSQVPNPTDFDRTVALVGAVGDRDPEVVRQNLFNAELQALADGFDVLVRERDGALRTIRALVQSPETVLSEARTRAGQIPSAQLLQRIGPVALAQGPLPPMWGPKALEKLCFAGGAWYGVGWGIDERTKTPTVRAIIRWDIAAKMPNLPLPGAVARSLWPTRNIIGHPAAPSVAATSESEAQEMAVAWARALADAATKSAAPAVATLISETRVGEMLAEILQRLEQILEEQRKMYAEYLDLKRRQVQLLERTSGARAAD
jgi:hypothetical protein